MLERGDDVQLIDVRETWEAEIVALPGAMILPLGRLPELTDAIDPDRPIVAYCHHGIRSAQAAGYLMQHGFDDVRHLAGGIDAWTDDVDPTLPRY
ncbi:rhodanese [Homoserinibacter sp. GY 40078]|nr:rhodanese [Homoserinibacter sp. GY 40078]